MKKTLVIGTVIILAVVAVWAYSQYTPGEGDRAGVSDVTGNIVFEGNAIQIKSGELEFEGYAVGKSHIATFDEWEALLYKNNREITGFEGTIQTNSVNTGIDRLDTHLQSDDFFDSQIYPEITFKSTNINSQTGEITGNFLFRGVEKEITFPVTITPEGISGEFFLDTEPFSFKYTAVNKEVRIKFSLTA